MTSWLPAAASMVLLLFTTFTNASRAADWPMWRADVRRSGSVDEPLPAELHLQWVRELPARRVAWPNESRLQFDASYEPVVSGRRLFVASSVDGSVTAFDTRSGEQLWRFYSEGPVRLAPVATRDRVYFTSDDGYLYCLRADSGAMLWKVRGAPPERPDYRHLGNARLISFWPARGGPVLHEGTVFFAAGIWPTLGIFVHAVDAQTGRIRWTNDNVHYIQRVRIDHNALDDVGLSPQGYCLISDGKLVVPNGRSMPARFDPTTGRLHYFVQGYRNGDARVTAGGDFLFVGLNGVVSIKDGREVGNRWVEAGKNAPAGWDGSKRDLFEGPFYGYKFMPGCDYRSVFDDNQALGVQKGTLYSYDLTRPRKSLYEKRVGTQVIHPARWDLEPLWRPLGLAKPAPQPTRVSIKAGSRLYTHVGRTLFAVDLPNDEHSTETTHTSREKESSSPRVAWKKQLDAPPTSLIAADGRLFAVLENNRLCCFGADKTEPHTIALPPAELSTDELSTARRLLEAAGVDDGYAVVLGLTSGRLVEALLSASKMRVVAVDSDAETINALRARWVQAGVYGTRVEAFIGDPLAFRFPPFLASLVVSERPGEDSPLVGLPPERLFAMLRPYGGVAVVPASLSAVERRWAEARIPTASIETRHGWLVLRRPEAPAGAADWTHETADAARTYFSRDRRVEAPLAILWYGDGPDHGFQKWKDYGRGVKPQVAQGRLFAFDDRAQQLTAIDIYTGRLLWRREMDTSLVRFASLPEAVYMAHGLKCDVLDPATGRVRRSLAAHVPVDPDQEPGAVAVRATERWLVLGIGFNLPAGHSHPAIESGLWDAKVLVVFDRRSGEQLWTRTAAERFNLHSISVGADTVFCVDSIAPLKADKLRRRGAAPKTFRSTLLALEADTGRLRWSRTFDYPYRAMTGRGPLAIRPYDDWTAYNAEHGLVLAGKLREIHALRAESGEEVWASPTAGMQPLILCGDTYINQAGHRFDVLSGRQLTKAPLFQRTGGCNYTVGNENLLFLRAKCATYVDVNSGAQHSLRNLRSGCSNSLVAAGGLLNVPCFSTGCICNYPLQTSFSMYHLPESADWSGTSPLTLTQE